MKTNFKGTKGMAKKFIKHRGSTKDSLIKVKLGDESFLEIGSIDKDDDCTNQDCCCIEEHSNAKLISDAFNVRQQIKFDLPELLERYNEAIQILHKCIQEDIIQSNISKLDDDIIDFLNKQ